MCKVKKSYIGMRSIRGFNVAQYLNMVWYNISQPSFKNYHLLTFGIVSKKNIDNYL